MVFTVLLVNWSTATQLYSPDLADANLKGGEAKMSLENKQTNESENLSNLIKLMKLYCFICFDMNSSLVEFVPSISRVIGSSPRF